MLTNNGSDNEKANDVGTFKKGKINQRREEPIVVALKKKALTYKIWEEFNREEINVVIDGKESICVKATCKYCIRVFDRTSDWGTTRLKKHLKTHSIIKCWCYLYS
jgi:BED zinc finger